MTRSCTARWGARRSSSPRNGEWTKRRRRVSPTPLLLIYHSYSGRERKRKLAARRAAVHLEVPKDHRPLLARGLCDVDALHQPVVPIHPDHRTAVGLVFLLRAERDHVHHRAAERVCPQVARAVALAWSLHELADRSEERRVGKECRSRWSPEH